METTLEVLIPLRNPTEVLEKTVASLAEQSERNFTVLFSDNHSVTGRDVIDAALAVLQKNNIGAKILRPPHEFGRVEHWNWLHYQSRTDWLKPLFSGDWLEADYIAAVRSVIAQEPACSYVFCGFQHHQGEETTTIQPRWSGRFFPPAEMQDVVMRYAMQFGPPSAAVYRSEIFLKAGGYDPSLPICADSLLFCQFAARHGAYGLPKAYTHFLIHAARFSHTLPEKERETFREKIRYCVTLGINAWHERWRFPLTGYLRLFAREIAQRRKAH